MARYRIQSPLKMGGKTHEVGKFVTIEDAALAAHLIANGTLVSPPQPAPDPDAESVARANAIRARAEAAARGQGGE